MYSCRPDMMFMTVVLVRTAWATQWNKLKRKKKKGGSRADWGQGTQACGVPQHTVEDTEVGSTLEVNGTKMTGTYVHCLQVNGLKSPIKRHRLVGWITIQIFLLAASKTSNSCQHYQGVKW